MAIYNLSKTFSAAAAVWVLLLLTAVPVRAQVAGASLSGTVKDASGGFVPEVQITIENQQTNIVRSLTTDKSGFYSAPNLPAGAYTITASISGFRTETRKDLVLSVGALQELDFTLNVGQSSERVEVTTEVPVVELVSSAVGSVVNTTTIRELPLNGRSWTDLTVLQPGVSPVVTQPSFGAGADRGNRGYGEQLSISGGKPVQNNYRLDGVSIVDYANGAPGSVLGVSLGVDAIQEFSVLTSSFSAEYGRTSGGVVNAITHSGTNGFHGNVYEFLRNSALDARNFFDPVNPLKRIPPFRRNQFGASAGAPIKKDRTFVFGDYEGIRQSKGISGLGAVPTSDARSGDLHDGLGPVTVDPAAAKYLVFWPLPNLPVTPGSDIGQFAFTRQQNLREDFFTVRIDHTFSAKDNLFGTYVFDNTPYTTPDNLNAVILGHHTRRQVIAVEESHIFNPSLINSARFGLNIVDAVNNHGVGPIVSAAADTSLASTPGQNAARVSVGGLANFTGGVGAVDNYTYAYKSYQFYDDASFTHGLHSIKFGGGFERILDDVSSVNDPAGLWTFDSLRNFLTNRPTHFDSGFLNTRSPRDLRSNIFGAYIQDDWRWHPNLTLNLGLRYETSTPPSETSGKLSNLLNLTDATAHLGSPLFHNPTLRNFEPRVGFAWDPFSNGKTSVRGGFGMFDVLPLPYLISIMQGRTEPFFGIGSVQVPNPNDPNSILAGKFFSSAFPLLGNNSLAASYNEFNPHRNYVMQWNLTVQHQIAKDLSAIVGYVASRGVHQPFRVDDADMVLPTLTPQGYLFPLNGTTLNPNFGTIHGLWWNARSYYDALELGVTKRMTHGLQLQGSFTWGKSIDNASGSGAPDAFGNSISSLHWYDITRTKAVSDFNIGKALVISSTWQIPRHEFSSTLMNGTLNGWELGTVFTAHDGVGVTPLIAGDPLGQSSSDPYAFPNRLSGPGCQSLVNSGNPNNYIKLQCFAFPTAPSLGFYTANCNPTLAFPLCSNLRGNGGRNIVTGPALVNLDFSVFKNFQVKRISEKANIQFRAEAFNILNRANFQAPIDTNALFDQSGNPIQGAGVLDATVTDAREIQFALKLSW